MYVRCDMNVKLIDLDFRDNDDPTYNASPYGPYDTCVIIQPSELFSIAESSIDSIAVIIVEPAMDDDDRTYVNDLGLAKYQNDLFHRESLYHNVVVDSIESILTPRRKVRVERITFANEWYLEWTKTCIVDGFSYEARILMLFGLSEERSKWWFDHIATRLTNIVASKT